MRKSSDYISIKKYLLFISILFILPNLTLAESDIMIYNRYNPDTMDKNYYVKFALGINKLSNRKNLIPNRDVKSYSHSFGVGGKFISNNRLELNYTQRNNIKYRGLSRNLILSENVLSDIKSSTIMLNLYSDQHIYDAFVPYFVLGVGLTKYDVKYNRDAYLNNVFTSSKEQSTIKKSFAWQAGAGVNIPINDIFSFDIGYRYSDLGKLPNCSITAIGNSVNKKLKNHEMLLGVLVKF